MGVYEETLEDIENTFGTVPGFMRLFPGETLVRDWPLWKRDSPGEIDLERARYLLSGDELLEENLSAAGEEVTDYRGMGIQKKARTVCCGMLVDADKALMARTKTGEEFLVCNDDCRRSIEMATPERIREIAAIRLH
ncbi:MAG: hypothetical protein OIN66_16235 [Candidatus Methanoperedens sp.]|nr:hypothetical protein [Candidatus Methanoperedens sp.]